MTNCLRTKFYLIAFSLLFFIQNENSFCQVTFVKAYNIFTGYYLRQTFDGGFIVTGPDAALGNSYDVYLAKMDRNGSLEWTKKYGGDSLEWTEYVEQTSDSGFILAGRTNSFGAGNSDIYIIKTNSFGDTLWTRTYGGPQDEFSRYVHESKDGGYYIIGSGFSFGNMGTIYFIKTNNKGDILWTKIYSTPNSNLLQEGAFETRDHGFIITGRIFGIMGDLNYLLKIDSVGNLQWDKYYGPSEGFGSRSYSVIQSSDGGYVMAGEKGADFSSGSVFYFNIIKTDSSGQMLWDKVYGDTTAEAIDAAFSIQETSDGGLIASGIIWSFGTGKIYLVKTDNNGILQWATAYGSSISSGGGFAIQAKDNGYVIACPLGLFSSSTFNLIKTDSLGSPRCSVFGSSTNVYSYNTTGANAFGFTLPGTINAGTPPTKVSRVEASDIPICYNNDIPEISGEHTIQIYPNPTHEFFTIILNKIILEGVLEIYNSIGKKVYSQPFIGMQKTINSKLINGIYYVKVITSTEMFVEKLIVD